MLFLKTQGTVDFIKSMIMCFGAPVINGIKCGSILNLARPGEDVRLAWYAARRDIADTLGVEFAEISKNERSVLIFMYKKELLLEAINDGDTRAFLHGLGYGGCVASCIKTLRDRFKSGVPHEMGIFLGYPLEDVKGFIENDGENSKLVGYWKVYGDERRAMRLFDEYKRAETESAWSLLEKAGVSMRLKYEN
jgi:hypothetical protein